jgi:hypothetical protein
MNGTFSAFVPYRSGYFVGDSMGQVLQFFRSEKAFDSETTATLVAAYEKAITGIENRGQTDTVREIIARRIITLASKGERNPDRLCAAALATIARTFAKTPEPLAGRRMSARISTLAAVSRLSSEVTALPPGKVSL